MIIGLTGKTGAGKSLIASIFEKHEFKVIDADVIARQVASKGSTCLKELENEFGSKILNSDKTLNRTALAKIAFENKENGLWSVVLTPKDSTIAAVMQTLELSGSSTNTQVTLLSLELQETSNNKIRYEFSNQIYPKELTTDEKAFFIIN